MGERSLMRLAPTSGCGRTASDRVGSAAEAGRLWSRSPATALAGMLVAFVASLAAAVALQGLVDRPGLRLADRLRPGGPSGPGPFEKTKPAGATL